MKSPFCKIAVLYISFLIIASGCRARAESNVLDDQTNPVNTLGAGLSMRIQVTGDLARKAFESGSITENNNSKSLRIMSLGASQNDAISLICKRNSDEVDCKVHLQQVSPDGNDYAMVVFNLNKDPQKNIQLFENFGWTESSSRPGTYGFGCAPETPEPLMMNCGSMFRYASSSDGGTASFVAAHP